MNDSPADDVPRDDTPVRDTPRDGDTAGRRGLPLSLIGWLVLGVVALGVVWIVVTGLIARSQLDEARSQIGQLRRDVLSGDVDRAERTVRSIRDDTDSASWLTSGPAWWVASHVPVLGSPLYTAREIATQSARLGDDVLPGVLELARTVPQTSRGAGSIDLAAIARAAPRLHSAATTADSAYRTLRGTDGSWLSYVASARASFVGQLARLDGELEGADRAARIVVPMLGREGPKRYFIGFLNESESRGGGGIPGAFAIATADDGRITFEHFGSDDELRNVRADVDLGPELTARYGNNDPTGVIQNSNLSPDFSVAGRIWAGMWQAKTGERIDGALAIDPTALSYLLRATGPTTVQGSPVSADTVIALTQQTQYRKYPGTSPAANNERKTYLTQIAKAISQRLLTADRPAALVKALARAAEGRRLVVWDRDATTERGLRTVGWAGQLGNGGARPFTGFTTNNSAGSKLDYYLDRTQTYRRSSCAAGARATAELVLHNDAPRTGLPAYVTYRADQPRFPVRPGDNRTLVTYYGSVGSRLVGATLDGVVVRPTVQTENNLTAITLTVELPVGSTRTLRLTLTEPAAASTGPDILEQPGVRAIRSSVSGARCR